MDNTSRILNAAEATVVAEALRLLARMDDIFAEVFERRLVDPHTRSVCAGIARRLDPPRDDFTSTVDDAAAYERARVDRRPTYIGGQAFDPDSVPSRAELGPDER